jgi:hypothetical protein
MRDYANRNQRPSSPRRMLLVMSVVMITLAVSLPFVLVYMHHKMLLEKKDIPQQKIDKKTVASVKPKDPSQQFDFYTLLPKMAVPNNLPTEKKSS